MNQRKMWICVILSLLLSDITLFGEGKEISLPAPPPEIKVDLMTALQKRKSTREYSGKEISLKDLSVLLWAAAGVNRKDGKRTYPTAMGKDYMGIYVLSASGIYRYDAEKHRLVYLSDKNVKDRVGKQGYVGKASHVILLAVRVKDTSILTGREDSIRYGHATAGCVAQNLYLAAGSMGMGTCLVAWISEPGIKENINLARDEVPLYIMPVGYLK